MSQVKYPGLEIEMAGQVYTVPPLSLGQVKRLVPHMAVFQDIKPTDIFGENGDKIIDAMISVIHAAMSRNYPDMTKEQLEDLVGIDDAAEICAAIMSKSGLEKNRKGPAADQK